MNHTVVAETEFVTVIEELESKTAPSGAMTLGDL